MAASNRLRNFFRQLVSGVTRNLSGRQGRAVSEDEAQTLVQRYLPAFERDVMLYTNNLVSGQWKVQQWLDNVEVALRNLYLTGAIAGAGHVGRLMPAVLHDVTQKLDRQRPFLRRFAAEIEAMSPEKRDPQAIVGRLLRYGKPAQEMVQRGLDRSHRRPALPFYPKDGTTVCLDGCYCGWDWVEVNADRGDWDVTWKLDAHGGRLEEHCSTCLARAVAFRPLKIRDGIIITNVNVPGVRARR